MDYDPRRNVEVSGYLEGGFPAVYDSYRPRPPAALPPILLRLAQIERPDHVVDLGCGTGRSTVLWAEYTAAGVGVEPNEKMRGFAQEKQAAEMRALREAHGLRRKVVKWPKGEHLQRIEESGHFRYVKEVLLHSQEMGTAERLIGIVHSMPRLVEPLQADGPKSRKALETLRRAATEALGDEPQPWTFSYRARIGLR